MTQQHPRRRSPLRRLAVFAALAICIVTAGGAAAFFADGGRLFVVRTPSMGTTAPVGTLVLTRPVAAPDVRVGDVIAFHPPTNPATTYTHRVVSVDGGAIRTRGDVNGAPDPWTLTGTDLIGRTVVVAPGVGWLLRAVPYLVGGGLLVWLLTKLWISPARRGPARLVGGSIVFLVATQVLQPFVGVSQLASGADAEGGTTIAAVSTGLLPVELSPAAGTGHADPLVLGAAGRTGTSVITGGVPGEQFHLDAALHLSPLQWVIALLICASPMLWTMLVGFREPTVDEADPAPERAARPELAAAPA